MVIISVKLLALPKATAEEQTIFQAVHDEVVNVLYIKNPVLSKILVLVYFPHFLKLSLCTKKMKASVVTERHSIKKKVILLMTESDESLHRHTCTHFQAPVSELEKEIPRSGPFLSQS